MGVELDEIFSFIYENQNAIAIFHYSFIISLNYILNRKKNIQKINSNDIVHIVFLFLMYLNLCPCVLSTTFSQIR